MLPRGLRFRLKRLLKQGWSFLDTYTSRQQDTYVDENDFIILLIKVYFWVQEVGTLLAHPWDSTCRFGCGKYGVPFFMFLICWVFFVLVLNNHLWKCNLTRMVRGAESDPPKPIWEGGYANFHDVGRTLLPSSYHHNAFLLHHSVQIHQHHSHNSHPSCKKKHFAMCDRWMAYMRPICVGIQAHFCQTGMSLAWPFVERYYGIINAGTFI